MVAACPPTDWRSRPLVDAYNKAVAAAMESHPHVGYIDNGPIVYPMWDSAGDWCHYHGRVAEAMAHHTLYQISRGGVRAAPRLDLDAKLRVIQS